MHIRSDDLSLIIQVEQYGSEMRSFTIILFMAICAFATFVHCQDDDDDKGSSVGTRFFFSSFLFLIPKNHNSPAADEHPFRRSSYSDDGIFETSSEVSSADEDERRTQDDPMGPLEMMPSDHIFDAEQSPFIVDYPGAGANEPAVKAPNSNSKASNAENDDQLPTHESAKDASNLEKSEKSSAVDNSEEIRRKQAQINDAFMRAFMHMIRSMSSSADSVEKDSVTEESSKEEPVAEKPIKPFKKEPTENKFAKKYVEDYFHKIQNKKPESASGSTDERVASNTKESNSQEKKVEMSSEVMSDSAHNKEQMDQVKENSEKSSDSKQDKEENVGEEEIESYETPRPVPLAPFPDGYDGEVADDDKSHVVDPLAVNVPPEWITPNPPFSHVLEEAIYQEQTTEYSYQSASDASQANDNEEENVEKGSEEANEENVEDECSASKNKQEFAPSESDKESIEIESTIEKQHDDSSNDNEIEKVNEIPTQSQNDKPIGRFSIVNLFRAIIDCLPLV